MVGTAVQQGQMVGTAVHTILWRSSWGNLPHIMSCIRVAPSMRVMCAYVPKLSSAAARDGRFVQGERTMV